MRWIIYCVFAIQAASCGQKGPLTLPESPAPAGSATPAIELRR